ncbi:MAG: SCO family protein [Burkholderiaceae bacterium]|nr:SCO family protein [Sulfuritalea sp.]MCF8173869.1 SCO family protein [Burkholderiaceae bacterium]MCF8185100.1 SCO family protein [Polynucleobacter sp.]
MRVLRAAAFGLACGAAVAALAAPAAKSTNGKAAAPTPKHSEEALPDGPLLPRYLLQDHNGRALTHEDFPGRFQLVSFGFTSCPDVCPTTLVAYKNILAALGKQAERLQPIFISVDPERDTPSMLREYTTAFDPRILGLTASPELVRHAADSFKVRYEKVREPGAAPDVYTMDHSTGMYLLGTDGRFLAKFAMTLAPKEAAARIRRQIEADHSLLPTGPRRGSPQR